MPHERSPKQTPFALLRSHERTPVMQFNSTVNAQHPHPVQPRKRLPRRAIPLTIAATVAVIVAAGVFHGVTAQDAQSTGGAEHGRECSNATLRGDYGRLSSGIRPAPANPALTESFVGTGLRTYDGQGAFTEVSSSHGQISPPNRNTPGTGTYEVNADCTGTSMIFIPGAPFPIETSFVVVDHGDEVKHAVMSPQPQIVTSVERRVGR
jgi:hypothetical protein